MAIFNAFISGVTLMISLDSFQERKKGKGWFCLFISLGNLVSAIWG